MFRFLITDIELDSESISGFEELRLIVLSPSSMTRQLLAWPGWNELASDRTLLVLPGNGAIRVGQYLPPNWLKQWQWLPVTAKRFWVPGEDPVAIAGRIHRAMLLGFRQVLVLDDVISSGTTIRQIRLINEPWTPGASWQAISWVAQASARTKGYRRIFSAVTVGDKQRKAPINSLSTLLADPQLACSYAVRNFLKDEEIQGFHQLLKQLRSRRP